MYIFDSVNISFDQKFINIYMFINIKFENDLLHKLKSIKMFSVIRILQSEMSNSFAEFEEVAEPVHHMCDICGKYCSSKSTIKENRAVGRGETKTTIPHAVRTMQSVSKLQNVINLIFVFIPNLVCKICFLDIHFTII